MEPYATFIKCSKYKENCIQAQILQTAKKTSLTNLPYINSQKGVNIREVCEVSLSLHLIHGKCSPLHTLESEMIRIQNSEWRR